jgi:hypothetical protein
LSVLPSRLLRPAWSFFIGPAESLPHWSQLALSFRFPVLLPYIYIYIYIYGPAESWLITSALKMVTAHFSKTLASTNQSMWHLNPKEHIRNVTVFENTTEQNFRNELINFWSPEDI